MKWNDPIDPVCITVDEVLEKKRDVLVVFHEEGHGGWSLMDGYDTEERKPQVVPKEMMLSIDPSLEEITDLEVGFVARRESKGSEWMISKM